MGSNNEVVKYINSNTELKKINNRRTRNMVIHQNSQMKVIYDLKNEELAFESSIPFSDIEHDTNRKYTEQI